VLSVVHRILNSTVLELRYLQKTKEAVLLSQRITAYRLYACEWSISWFLCGWGSGCSVTNSISW
jgi:hypothetical protein